MEGWVTIGKKGEDKDGKHGGTHVFIGSGGKIQKGPSHMVGKTPGDLKHEITAKHASDPRPSKTPRGNKPATDTTKTSTSVSPAVHPVHRMLDPTEVRTFKTHPEDKDLPDTVTGFAAKLSPEEKKSIDHYTQSGYATLNKDLRKGLQPKGGDRKIMDHLDAAMGKAGTLDKPITTWRGLSLPPQAGAAMEENLKKAVASGQPITMKGFISSSLNPEVGASFSKGLGEKAMVFEVSARKGMYIGAVPGRGHISAEEREFLMPHDSKFHVVGFKTVKFKARGREMEKRTVVQLEQVV
jgi:hypothetical protein